MTRPKHRLAFIGAGNMAEAIARAAIEHGVVPAEQIVAADPTPARRAVFEGLGVATTQDNALALASADQAVLAVKPQALSSGGGELGRQLGGAVREGQVVVSIMAGVTSAGLAATLGREAEAMPIVRVMPNTPMLVGRGMAGVALGPGAREGDDALAMALFSAGRSRAIRVPEAALDAITAVSGSGPAYLFYLAEGMTAAALELGLSDEQADTLVRQTLLGSAELLAASAESAGELRRRVTSPGGTTEAAIRHLDGNASRQVIVNALKAAADRSRELGA
jgi:pyrroline-5-carboxylate reductase